MDTPCRPTRKRLFFLILSALAIGCAKSPYIHVNYIPPASMDAFAEQKVYSAGLSGDEPGLGCGYLLRAGVPWPVRPIVS